MTVWNHVRISLQRGQEAVCADRYVVCGSLARGLDRPIRDGSSCDCDEGWAGINCNVCTNDLACDPLMGTKDGGRCYKSGWTVNHAYQMCDVTNKKILEILEGKIPQVTFDCQKNKDSGDETCDFQCMLLPLPPRRPSGRILTALRSLGRSARVLHVPLDGMRVRLEVR